MTDDEKDAEETTARCNDWEVVSLTASAYAAAPSATDFQSADVDKDIAVNRDESTCAMLMSDHFIFPPYQHENSPLGSDSSKIFSEPGGEDCVNPIVADTNLSMEMGERFLKDNQKNSDGKELSETSKLHGTELLGIKGVGPIEKVVQYKEEIELGRLDLVMEEANTYKTDKNTSVHGAESSITSDPSDTFDHSFSPSPSSPKTDQSRTVAKAFHPCKSWWKRHAQLLYTHTKESNSIWSVVVAAALMGVVILGRKWHKDRWQIQQLKLQFGVNDETMGHVLRPFTRFKDVLVGGPRREVLGGGASAEH